MKMKNNLISDEELKSILIKPRLGSRNHYICSCNFCGKENHFYINRTTQQWDCKKCGEDGNIVKLLHHLGKLFLLGEFKSIERGKIKLLDELNKEETEEDFITQDRPLPIGFKRVYYDDYLIKRKFTKNNFKRLKIGYTELIPSLKDYVIFAIEEDGQNKGYVARLNWSKQKCKEYEKESGKKIIRYRNDKGAKFSNLLYGFDEITENTKTIILVEGIPDKVTLDNTLELHKSEEIKCCATFGKKISSKQVIKLCIKKSITKIILIFDNDAIMEMKKFGSLLTQFFDVYITYTFKKDINDSEENEIFEMFDRLKNSELFNRKNVKLFK